MENKSELLKHKILGANSRQCALAHNTSSFYVDRVSICWTRKRDKLISGQFGQIPKEI